MPGETPQQIPQWLDMLSEMGQHSDYAAMIDSDALAGFAIGGPIGAAVGALIGLGQTLAGMFHTSHSHSEVLLGELQNKGFKQFDADITQVSSRPCHSPSLHCSEFCAKTQTAARQSDS